MTEAFVLLAALLLAVFLGLLRWRPPRRRPARPAAPDASTLDAARREAADLALRGSIFAVTTEPDLPDHALRTLGEVSCQARSKGAAELALKRRAAERFDTANVLVGLGSRVVQERYRAGTGPRGNPFYKTRERTEWTATACEAIPEAQIGRVPPEWNPGLAIIDGSNVAYWGTPDAPALEPVRAVIDCLRREGTTPYVVFDANIGYKVKGRHLDKNEMRRALGGVRYEIVPAGTIADVRIIELASAEAATIVTNDLFRDHPESRPIPKRRGYHAGGVAGVLPPRP